MASHILEQKSSLVKKLSFASLSIANVKVAGTRRIVLPVANDEEVNVCRKSDFQERKIVSVWKPCCNGSGCYLQAFLIALGEESL